MTGTDGVQLGIEAAQRLAALGSVPIEPGLSDDDIARVEDVFAKYAAQLSDKPGEQAQLRSKALPVSHLDYDWSLNDAGR